MRTNSRSELGCWLLASALTAASLAACGGHHEDAASQPGSGGSSSNTSGRPSGGPSSSPGYAPPGTPSGVSGSGGSSGANVGGSAGAAGGLTGAPAVMQPPTVPPPANTGDKFRAPGTNPFVMTTHDPFSTFAADVDTASYDIFRRDVKLGGLPRPESVRLEEYVNFFKYEYAAPSPTDKAPFKVSVAAAGQVFDRQTVLLRVGIQGKLPSPYEKRPANLVFLVDVSGSMASPDKLPLVQKVLSQTLSVLDPADKVSIVTYSQEAKVRVPPTAVAQRAVFDPVIAGLQAAGSTAGAAALELAYQQAASGFINEGINHVLMLTDGDFNVGLSSTKDMVAMIREKRKTGVTLTVLGFGVGNLNDDLMESVSNAGNGIYGHINDEAAASKYVSQKMLSTLEHIAKDVKIQVEFNPEAVAAYRLLGYENRAIADMDFRNDGIDAGEIGAGHRVTALYELVPRGGQVPTRMNAPAAVDGQPSTLPKEVDVNDLVMVKVRWKTVFANEATPAEELTASLPRAAVSTALSAADLDLQWAAAVAGFAEVLKNSPYADGVQLAVVDQIVKAQAARDEDRRDFADLFARAVKLMPATRP